MKRTGILLAPLLMGAGCVVASESRFVVDEDVDAVVIVFENGDIEVRGDPDADEVLVEMEVGGLGFGDVGHFVNDGVLYIDGDCGRVSLCGGRVEVTVPARVALDLELNAGDVEVDGVMGPLFASLGAGDFYARSLGGPEAVVLVGAGDLSMELAEPFRRLDVEVGAGAIDLEVPAGGYDMDLDAGAGAVDTYGVSYDSQADAEIRASTGAGEISITGR
jgi:hypothetical protein